MEMAESEINESVARKLGWIIDKTSDYLPWYGRPNGLPESAMVRELPDYCHSIEAAWGIVEKFDLVIGKGPNELWYVDDGWSELSNHLAKADTAPMAICRAFLELP